MSLRILQNCKQSLDAEELRYQKEEKFEHEEYKHRMIQFEFKLKSYISGTSIDMDWKPHWLLSPLVIAVWKYDVPGIHTDLPQIVLLETVKDQLNTWCSQGISFVSGNDEIVTLLADHNGSGSNDIRSYHQQLSIHGEPNFTVGISPSIHSFKSVRDAKNSLEASHLRTGSYVWKLSNYMYFDGRIHTTNVKISF